MKRSAGILMPISSLPSSYGIGTFGKAAFKFVDFLAHAKQSYWQILPVIDELSKLSGIPVPKAVSEIRDAEIIHKTECEKDQMMEQVEKFLS